MWMLFVSDMENLINGSNVKVILVGWIKLNGQKMLLLIGQAHLLSNRKILCEWDDIKQAIHLALDHLLIVIATKSRI